MDRTRSLKAITAAEKQQLAEHHLYSTIASSPDVRRAIAIFMERHVVCVLDFMSILKSLQRDLTCTSVPWVPARVGPLTRLINEIVLGEESDEVTPGRHLSHYEWYLEAMSEVGADTAPARALESALRAGVAPLAALERSGLPRDPSRSPSTPSRSSRRRLRRARRSSSTRARTRSRGSSCRSRSASMRPGALARR